MHHCTGVADSERPTRIFPEKAVLYCRIGKEAMKANIQEKATANFRKALELNPMLWEAFEGLCTVGKQVSAGSRSFAC